MANNFKEVLKHSGNYMIANLATRALAFVSIPVYTNLLNETDYGVVAVFMGLVSIFSSILALNCDTAVSRYYFDRKSDTDFKEFVGTTVVLCSIIATLTSALIYLNIPFIAKLVDLPQVTIKLLVPLVLLNIIGLLFSQIYQPQKLSRPIAISSLTRVYLGFAISIGIILVMSTDKYLGQISGQIIAAAAMLFYWTKKIAPFFSFSFKKEHVNYILKYSVPLIPYVLSGVIVEQFGKIAVGSDIGLSQAGFYSLAVSIASLTAIVTEVTHQAWYPYYVEYMKSGNYQAHDNDLKRIFKISVVFGLFISCFGQEIGNILAKSNFTSALYLVPVLVIGYLFHQLSYAYMRNFSYILKTGYMSIIVIAAGCSNVLLNILLIPRFGINGAALSMMLSYTLMAILSWSFSTFLLKSHGIKILTLLKPLSVVILAILPLYFILGIDNFLLRFASKLFLFAILSTLLLYNERIIIIHFIRKFIKNH